MMTVTLMTIIGENINVEHKNNTWQKGLFVTVSIKDTQNKLNVADQHCF
jgi:hypothetical protein